MSFLINAVFCCCRRSKPHQPPPEPPPEPTHEPTHEPIPEQAKNPSIKKNLWYFISKPSEHVMENPTNALLYTTTIKIISLFIAIISPFIGYTILGISIALIDREIALNFKTFSSKTFHHIRENYKDSTIITYILKLFTSDEEKPSESRQN